MKSILLTVLMVTGTQQAIAQSCDTTTEGKVVYESKTVIGNQALFIKPGICVGGVKVPAAAQMHRDAIVDNNGYDKGTCLALGYEEGAPGSAIAGTEEGLLVYFAWQDGSPGLFRNTYEAWYGSDQSDKLYFRAIESLNCHNRKKP